MFHSVLSLLMYLVAMLTRQLSQSQENNRIVRCNYGKVLSGC